MAADIYRRKVSQIRDGIANLMNQKARESQKAADAVKKCSPLRLPRAKRRLCLQ